MLLSPNSRLKINFKAYKQNALKRTKSYIQSDLSDFVYKPGNLFQGGYVLMLLNCELHSLPDMNAVKKIILYLAFFYTSKDS